MAIRDKIKAKFSKNKTTTSEESSNESTEGHYTGRTDIEYYKPHEIPKSKYRGRVDKDHQEMLDAFSFGDVFQQATRRASAALSGTFSPGGTKAFSRRTSYASTAGMRTPARSRRSSLSSDANASFSVPSSGSDSTHVRSIPAIRTPTEPVVAATAEHDTDATSTDISRMDTVKVSQYPTATIDGKNDSPSQSHIENTQATSMPFSTEELTQAMTRATITPQATAPSASVAAA